MVVNHGMKRYPGMKRRTAYGIGAGVGTAVMVPAMRAIHAIRGDIADNAKRSAQFLSTAKSEGAKISRWDNALLRGLKGMSWLANRKAALAGLGALGAAGIGGVLGRNVQHSYRRSQVRFPNAPKVRGVMAGIFKGPFSGPVIAIRDLRRKFGKKQYGLGGL